MRNHCSIASFLGANSQKVGHFLSNAGANLLLAIKNNAKECLNNYIIQAG